MALLEGGNDLRTCLRKFGQPVVIFGGRAANTAGAACEILT